MSHYHIDCHRADFVPFGTITAPHQEPPGQVARYDTEEEARAEVRHLVKVALPNVSYSISGPCDCKENADE